jgi:hypothetical protein
MRLSNSLHAKMPKMPKARTPSGIPTPSPILVPRSPFGDDGHEIVAGDEGFVAEWSPEVVADRLADVRFATIASKPSLNAMPVPKSKDEPQQDVELSPCTQ